MVVLGVLDISVAMVTGAVAMVLTGCLTMDEAYESIDWRTVFLVAGMLPLGTAMESTGAARYIADLLLNSVGGWGPLAALGVGADVAGDRAASYCHPTCLLLGAIRPTARRGIEALHAGASRR